MNDLGGVAIERLKADLLGRVAAAPDLEAVEGIRLEAIGRKGSLTAAMKLLANLEPAARREQGQSLNSLKEELVAALRERRLVLERQQLDKRLSLERIDTTLPCRSYLPGRVHPISQTVEEIIAIFADMGFALAEGPDIEDDFHNFTALNFPPGHPAREMHDTFYLPDAPMPDPGGSHRVVLRTHTSSVQVRTMMTQSPPIRIICPGRTYRSDHDLTHTPMFHQVEGLVIDETTNMAHLKGCLMEFCRAFFAVDDLPIRFRPSFFPFTEPSAEVDIGCARSGSELRLGPHGDWLEILGCGMVHPNVLRQCGVDPIRYQGFAFGMGIERLAMLKHGIPDLRTFFEADLRWLRHYGFLPLDRPNLSIGLTA